MSQQGARKAGKAAGISDGGRCRSRSTAPKPAGDDAKAKPARKKHRSKSRNKIPKSVRYDLENALVGLCNVWFEDIKPHLLRNNIKVHVHPSRAAAGATGAEGDQQTGATPAPPRCRHVNPGAAPDSPPHPSVNFADFCLTRPTASSAPSPRRRVLHRPRPALPPLPSPPTSPHSQDLCHNCESDVRNQLRKSKNRRHIKTSTHDKSNSNPTLCNELDLYLNLSNLKIVPKKTKTKEMGSQTEYPVPYSVSARRHRSCTRRREPPRMRLRCADSHRKVVIRKNKSTQTDLYLYFPLKARSSGPALKRKVRSPRLVSPRRIQSASRKRSTSCVRPSSRLQSSSHVVRIASRIQSPPKRASASLRKISPSSRDRSVIKTRVYEDLFREEFFEDIAEKRDTNISLLYRSPRMEKASSVVNAGTMLSVNIQRKKFNKKLTPGHGKHK